MRRMLLSAMIVTLAGCASTPGGAAVTDESATVAAFYGDSYTLGTGASDPSVRWSTVISEQRGWTEFNPSVNGLGFINNRGSIDLPGDIIAVDPDIVFVTMGLNDNFSYEARADDTKAQITLDLQRLTAELPDARVIVVEPFWYTDERPESVEVIIGWVKDAAEAIDAEYIPGASRWIEGRPDWMAADGLHPNDEGYAEMAARMDAALSELGL